MFKRKKKKLLLIVSGLLIWAVYKYLLGSSRTRPIILYKNKLVQCINTEDLFNISSHKIYSRGSSSHEMSCKLNYYVTVVFYNLPMTIYDCMLHTIHPASLIMFLVLFCADIFVAVNVL